MATVDEPGGEDKPARKTPDIRQSVIIYQRAYEVARGAKSTLPTRGDVVALSGVSGSGLETPRVLNRSIREQSEGKRGGQLYVTIWYIQIRPYA